MPDIRVELPGAQFERAYLLYIIEIRHGRDDYFYVGQTGDNRYVTARPPFRRLSGHLEDSGTSTQNQVYRYIAVDILGDKAAARKMAFSESVKQGVENFLVDSTVLMHVYRVQPFMADVSRTVHLGAVRDLSLLEKHVIAAFLRSGKRVMNKAISFPTQPCPNNGLLARIKSDFGL